MPRSPEEDAERRDALADLEAWLRTPMMVLSALWLALVLVELTWGSSALLESFGVAIWVVFLAEFALRLWLAPEKGEFLRRE